MPHIRCQVKENEVENVYKNSMEKNICYVYSPGGLP